MQTFLELLARNALGAALLAIVVLVLTSIVRRPAVRNALWLIVFARLLLPPLWSVPIFPAKDAPESSRVQTVAARDPIGETAIKPSHPAPALLDAGEILPAPAFALSIDAVASAESDVVERNVAETPAAGTAVTGNNSLPIWLMPVLFAIWLIGFVLVVSLAVVRVRRFERGLRDAIRAPDDIQEQAEFLARRLGLKHSPSVLLAPGRVPPMLWMSGLFARQARLILPLELCFRLDTEQRSAVMAHELAHLRRGDPWVRWLELLAVAVYWWFPLLGFFRRRLRESEEQCCDGWVVALLSERKAYATALVETVEYLDRPDQPAAPALASGASPVHNLQRRLTMIMRGSARGRLSRFGTLAVLGLAVGALAFGPAFSQQDPPREKKERGEKGEGEFQPKEKGRFEPKGRGEGDFQPKDDNRFGPRDVNKEEVERAMQELQRAREEAERAVQRVREMEERIQRLVGGREGGGPPRGPGREGGAPPRGPGPIGIGGPGPGSPGPVGPGRGPMGGTGPGVGPGPLGGGPGPVDPAIGRGGDRPIQELQRQVEEMRRMIEELRREINRGTGGRGGPDAMPKEKLDRNFRPANGLPGGPGGPPGRPGGLGGSGGGPGGNPGGGFRGNPGAPGERGAPEKLPQPPEQGN
jgi:beta-lactamase regulating signal transducer with metallopeptidase domain